MYCHQSLPLHLLVFMYLGASMSGGLYCIICIRLIGLDWIVCIGLTVLYCSFYNYIVSSFLSFSMTFKVYFVRYEHCYNHFLVISICMKYLFPYLHFQSMCVLCPKVGLSYATYSVFSHSIVSNSLRPHGPQHTRSPCPSPTPRVHPNSCPLSRWCHPTISSSVVPFSFHL